MVTGVGATQQVAGSPATTQIPPAEPVKRSSSDNRRSNKPIMEKRRRARINNCLNELKALILDAMKKDPARHSKLEKADILEMTVKHLENLQRQQSAMSQATDPSVMNKFKAGFNECAQEVGRFPEIDPLVKRRLMQHLSNCINGVKAETLSKRHHHQQQSSPAGSQAPLHILPSPPSSPEQHHHHYGAATTSSSASGASHHHLSPLSAIQTGNGSVYMTNGVGGSSVQLIPTKLPNGSLAFVLPQSAPVAPVPMLVPIPTRTASTGSASSSHSGSSSSLYDRVSRDHATSPYHAPPSPANSNYEPMECQSVQPHHQYYLQQQQQQQHQQQQQQQQQSFSTSSSSSSSSSGSSSGSPDSPLSLVMKKPYHDDVDEDDQDMKQEDDDGKACWRPW
ncbi:protein hairy [Anopheles aquasalis]|uniref:protein hairy n=1 Tax=Anopheles aquasalis TaxID=42839 RepID=UPI00215B33BF|nr:protein hairy [Anopheles aquasalis]